MSLFSKVKKWFTGKTNRCVQIVKCGDDNTVYQSAGDNSVQIVCDNVTRFNFNNGLKDYIQYEFDVTIHKEGSVLVFDSKWGKSILTCSNDRKLSFNDLSDILVNYAIDCSDNSGIQFSAENYKQTNQSSLYDGRMLLTFSNVKMIDFIEWFKRHYPDIEIVGNAFGYTTINGTNM